MSIIVLWVVEAMSQACASETVSSMGIFLENAMCILWMGINGGGTRLLAEGIARSIDLSCHKNKMKDDGTAGQAGAVCVLLLVSKGEG